MDFPTGWHRAAFVVACALSASLPALTQPVLSGRTEAALLDQLHREAATERYRDTPGRRQFPQEFTDDELLDLGLALDPQDTNPANQAIQELKKRYEDASTEEHTALANRLRAEYQTTPYPILLPDLSNSAEYNASQENYSTVDRAASALLPEAVALALFRDIYLNSGQKGAITRFLLSINGEPFTGPPTLAVLEELRIRTAAYDESELRALGELEGLGTVVNNQIRTVVGA